MRSGIYGIIAITAFYTGTLVNYFNDDILNVSVVQVKKTITVADPRAEPLSPYEEALYKKFYTQSENCAIAHESTTLSKLCSYDIKEAVDNAIINRISDIKQKINIKIEKFKKSEDGGEWILKYIENMPGYIDDTYKEWLDYRSSYCNAITESSIGGSGYSGFINSCEHDEAFKFMKFLDMMQADWIDEYNNFN